MAATVAAPLERRLGEIPGVTELTSTSLARDYGRISVQFDLARNIDSAARDVQAALNAARHATCRAICRRCRPSARPTRPPRPILILALTSDTCPRERDVRRRRHRARPAHLPGRRRRRGHGDRRRAAGHPRAGQSRRGRRDGHQPRGRAHSPSSTPMRRARSASFDRRHRRTRPSPPTTSCARAAEYRDIVVTSRERHRDRCSARSPRSTQDAQQPLGRPGTTASPRCCSIVTKQADANVIETVDRIQALLPELKRWIPAGSSFGAGRPHARRSAPACTTCSSRLARPSCW